MSAKEVTWSALIASAIRFWVFLPLFLRVGWNELLASRLHQAPLTLAEAYAATCLIGVASIVATALRRDAP